MFAYEVPVVANRVQRANIDGNNHVFEAPMVFQVAVSRDAVAYSER